MGLGRLPRRSRSPIIARARGRERERELLGCRQCKAGDREREAETPLLQSSRVDFTGDRDARSPACSLAISASYGWQRFVVRVEGEGRPGARGIIFFFPRPPRAAVARRAHGAFVPVRGCCAERMSRPGMAARGEGAGLLDGAAGPVRAAAAPEPHAGVSPEASLSR
jgi:hypothetical protein